MIINYRIIDIGYNGVGFKFYGRIYNIDYAYDDLSAGISNLKHI